MPLKVSSIFDSDTTGSTETLALQAFPPANATQVTIVSAFYGRDASGAPIPIPIPAKRKNLSFTMLPGINTLTLTLTSPDPQDQPVIIAQGTTTLATVVVRNHSGFSTIFLRGV